MRSRLLALGASVLFLASAGTSDEPARRYQIELLYTVHANLNNDEKFERIRALVLKAYPDAVFAEVSVQDRRTYLATYRDRLLGALAMSWANLGKLAGADPDPKTWDDATRQRVLQVGYQLAKDQVGREVELRSIYQFLHAQAKDDVSLGEVFKKLKERDDPKDPVCGTEPGKTLIVYRDFGGKGLSRDELMDIEDSGVKFGLSFPPRVIGMSLNNLPKVSPKADTLGNEGHGRQIFRLVAVTKDPAPEAPADPK
jgi:hypothetical protein